MVFHEGSLFVLLFNQVRQKSAEHRRVSVCLILKLVCVSKFDNVLSTCQWHTLGRMCHDADLSTRKLLVRKIQAGFSKHHLSIKYLSLLVLMAREHDTDLKKEIKLLFGTAIQKMRWRQQQPQNEKEMNVVPEYIMPYAIHLILHVEEDVHHVASIQFLLDGLVSSEADNISFLMQILEMLSNCSDVMKSGKKLDELLATTLNLLKKKIKTQHSLKPYPGKIFLPMHLFQPRYGINEKQAKLKPNISPPK